MIFTSILEENFRTTVSIKGCHGFGSDLVLRYSRYINRNGKRIGHFFQARFKANLVDESDYLLKLIRYVHLNPVGPGFVTIPEHYLWSGHLAYMGEKVISWLYQVCYKYTVHCRKLDTEFSSSISLKGFS